MQQHYLTDTYEGNWMCRGQFLISGIPDRLTLMHLGQNKTNTVGVVSVTQCRIMINKPDTYKINRQGFPV